MKRSGFWWAATVGVAAGAFFALERLRPSRRTREPGAARVLRNLTIGMLAAATTAGSEAPVVAPVQRIAVRRRLGVLRWIPLPPVREPHGPFARFTRGDWTFIAVSQVQRMLPLIYVPSVTMGSLSNLPAPGGTDE